MRNYSLGRGRKKAIKKFTTHEGGWMLGIISAVLVAIALLWMLGYLHFDVD
jgi:hypothetical protein